MEAVESSCFGIHKEFLILGQMLCVAQNPASNYFTCTDCQSYSWVSLPDMKANMSRSTERGLERDLGACTAVDQPSVEKQVDGLLMAVQPIWVTV